MFTRALAVAALTSQLTVTAFAAPLPQQAVRQDNAGAATARRLAAIRDQPLLLRAFLREMPKGGDLHSHLTGAVYAESYLRWAAEDNLCLATTTMTIVAGTCDAQAGRPPMTLVLQNAALYSQAIDAMSMRNWNPAASGHDHFFATFAKFGPAATRTGDMLAEVASRAASEHVSYLEVMLSPAATTAAQFARDIGWDSDLARFQDRLLAAGFREAVRTEARQRLDGAETRQREVLRCASAQPDPGCTTTIRYVSQVLRGAPPQRVFADILAGFELATFDPRVISINLVQAEDDPTAVRDFSLHMSMIDFLHVRYPRVPITLHAGELIEGLVPPEALRSHVRQSIETGHARRIGHGIDLMDEDDPLRLLRGLAAKNVLIETALTSNEQILGVAGKRHPLALYLKYGVPVALVTDDLGVSRSSHTQEFQKAVEDQGLDYPTLKRLVRNSLEYAFADPTTKKRLQADLEGAFSVFEQRMSQSSAPIPAR